MRPLRLMLAALQLRGHPVHVSGELAWEHFLNPGPTYATDSALLSVGAGWRL